MKDVAHPPLRAVPMTLFPTAESLQGAVDRANALLPIHTANELHAMLMLYHNTLLNELQKNEENPKR
jgi:hypothetical protein